MEEALFEQKERAQVTLDSIGDAVICTDIKGNITFLNVVAETMTGWPRQEAAGRPAAEVLQIRDATTGQTIPNPMAMAIQLGRAVNLPPNCILVRRDGHEIAIEDSVAPIHDRAGLATGAVIVFRDGSVGRAMALRMAHAAEHDFLTGLPNRMLLNDRVDRAIGLVAVTPRVWRCCFWIWTVSNTSTIRWDIRPATSFFNPSQGAWLSAYATRTR